MANPSNPARPSAPVFEALVQTAAVADHIRAWDGTTVTRLGHSRSGSAVYKISPLCQGAARSGPLVFKTGPAAAITRECRNYLAHAKEGLPAGMRPELVAECAVGSQAGLCFSWVGDRSGTTLSYHLQCADAGAAQKCASALIKVLQDSWYRPSEQVVVGDLAGHYVQRHFSVGFTLDDGCAALCEAASRNLGGRLCGDSVVIAGSRFQMAPLSLLQAGDRSFLSCVVHGDCNSDNVIVPAGSAGIALIDFEKTGHGYALEDFIYFEASIRINFPHHGPLEAIFESEQQIAAGSGDKASPYAVAINAVRRAAFTNFANADHECYHFAVAAIACRLMRTDGWSLPARNRIVASALWALRLLGC